MHISWVKPLVSIQSLKLFSLDNLLSKLGTSFTYLYILLHLTSTNNLYLEILFLVYICQYGNLGRLDNLPKVSTWYSHGLNPDLPDSNHRCSREIETRRRGTVVSGSWGERSDYLLCTRPCATCCHTLCLLSSLQASKSYDVQFTNAGLETQKGK